MFHVKHSIKHTDISEEALKYLQTLEEKNAEQLKLYSDQLLWWNQKVNLVSREVSRETIREHIRHSLLISATDSFRKAFKILDTGTGGGLPGLPLALCFQHKEFVLNDIVTKKIIAVKQMMLKLKLSNVGTTTAPVESVDVEPETLVVSKHAFKADDLIGFLGKKPWGNIVLLKGAREAEEELQRVEEVLEVNIIHLDKQMDKGFYEGKAVVEIKRKGWDE